MLVCAYRCCLRVQPLEDHCLQVTKFHDMAVHRNALEPVVDRLLEFVEGDDTVIVPGVPVCGRSSARTVQVQARAVESVELKGHPGHIPYLIQPPLVQIVG